MNSFFTLGDEPFTIGESNLHKFMNRPQRLEWGLIFICRQGEAVISTDIINYEIRKNGKATLLPGTIFTLHEASKDFKVSFIAFTHTLFEEANYRLEPNFFRFLKDNPVYHLPEEKVNNLLTLFLFLTYIYHDPENRFRYHIARNLLQCIFWETYDKTQRYFEDMKGQGYNNMDDLFRKFITLLRIHYKEQREVTFYADQLCITPRYLSFITKQITRRKSAKDIINSHIILEIKILLQSTHLPIQEIAHRLNFPDQSYLGRYFKRYAGVSPSEYRNITEQKTL